MGFRGGREGGEGTRLRLGGWLVGVVLGIVEDVRQRVGIRGRKLRETLPGRPCAELRSAHTGGQPHGVRVGGWAGAGPGSARSAQTRARRRPVGQQGTRGGGGRWPVIQPQRPPHMDEMGARARYRSTAAGRWRLAGRPRPFAGFPGSGPARRRGRLDRSWHGVLLRFHVTNALQAGPTTRARNERGGKHVRPRGVGGGKGCLHHKCGASTLMASALCGEPGC